MSSPSCCVFEMPVRTLGVKQEAGVSVTRAAVMWSPSSA